MRPFLLIHQQMDAPVIHIDYLRRGWDDQFHNAARRLCQRLRVSTPPPWRETPNSNQRKQEREEENTRTKVIHGGRSRI